MKAEMASVLSFASAWDWLTSRPLLAFLVCVLLGLLWSMYSLFRKADRSAAELVRVNAALGGDRVSVSVKDRGRGISPEFQSRVFEKFAQADASSTRDKEGTGLGLSISKAIVESHGGRLGFETGAGGTTFRFELPEWEGARGSRPPRGAALARASAP
jgi:light-regulated signal transduction histidine kinase (bacteriophytochrome)